MSMMLTKNTRRHNAPAKREEDESRPAEANCEIPDLKDKTREELEDIIKVLRMKIREQGETHTRSLN